MADAIRVALDAAWQRKGKMDWLALETLLVNVLREDAGYTADERVRLAREVLDAFTRRGHFRPEDY